MKTTQPHIALVGPTTPYRGGISQYTTTLLYALRKQSQVCAVSFKRLYPRFLYPGQSDQTPGLEKQLEPGVAYILDIYNPRSWHQTAQAIVASNCQVAILTWWTLLWQPGMAYIAWRLRKHNITTIYLCHNLVDHQSTGAMGLITRLTRPLSLRWLRQADRYIIQSSDDQAKLERYKPGAISALLTHPVYDRFPVPKHVSAPRGRLDLLFFGLIRPYKGLDILLSALEQISDTEIYVTVAGEPWGDKGELRQQIAAVSDVHIDSQLRYVSDSEVAELVSRADAVVLPYRSATGSGVTAVAYHYGKPVIATNVGGLKDVVLEGVTGYLVAPEDPAALAAVIRNLNRSDLAAMQPAIANYCQEHSWEAFVSSLLTFSNP